MNMNRKQGILILVEPSRRVQTNIKNIITVLFEFKDLKHHTYLTDYLSINKENIENCGNSTTKMQTLTAY